MTAPHPTDTPDQPGTPAKSLAESKNSWAQFYELPTPLGAVRLAIDDARADGNGTPDYFHHLNRGVAQLETFPDLVAVCDAIANDSRFIRLHTDHQAMLTAALAKAKGAQ